MDFYANYWCSLQLSLMLVAKWNSVVYKISGDYLLLLSPLFG